MSSLLSAVSRQRRIGVFDSGIGANLVADEIRKKISGVKVFVKTDPEYFPYGDKTLEVIQSRLVHFAKEFQKEGCQIVVIACNSATTNGITELRKQFPNTQFVGIEPPVKPIVRLTKSGKVAVIGTEATMRSGQLKRLIQRDAAGVNIHLISCPGLAELIEEQVKKHRPKAGNDHIKYSTIFYNMNVTAVGKMIRTLLDQPVAEGVDVVGIACTHYPYVLPLMKKLYPKITFYDPTEAVISRVKELVMSFGSPDAQV